MCPRRHRKFRHFRERHPDIKITPELQAYLENAQRNEITEHHVYRRLAQSVRKHQNRQLLEKLAHDELRHYHTLEKYTGKKIRPNQFKLNFFYFIIKVFGLTFGAKLLERAEDNAQSLYQKIEPNIPEAKAIIADEEKHEKQVLSLVNKEALKYVSSIVLGLNDALVELTGALAGFSFALQNTKLTAIIGFITGVSASLSMAASEYLSVKSEKSNKDPVKSSLYTGLTYIAVVLILVSPFFLLTNLYLALAFMLGLTLIIIFFFNFYISVAQEKAFTKRFLEMAGISLSVAFFSFVIGFLARKYFGVNI